jgi:transcriptional regulator with XRE-family HTH domain
MNFEKTLKSFKYTHKLSNPELSKLLNISATHLSQVMNGKRTPSAKLMNRIMIVSNNEVDIMTFFANSFTNSLTNSFTLYQQPPGAKTRNRTRNKTKTKTKKR